MNKIYVIGTGIAGLSFYENCQQKDNVFFIEKNEYNGGRVKTINSGSSYFEIGSQFFCKSDKYLWKLIEKKGLNKDVIKLDFSNISFYYKEIFHSDLNEIAKVIENIMKTPIGDENNIMFDEWYLKNFKKNTLYIPKGIIRAITFSDSSNTMAYYGKYILETFFQDCYTLKYGLEELINSLSKKLKIEKKMALKFDFRNNKLKRIITDKGIIDTDKNIVISTAPPGEIEIQNNKELLKIINKIDFCGCIVVVFKINKGFYDMPQYIFIPENKYKISVIEQMEIGEDIFVGCLIPHHSIKIKIDEIIDYIKVFLNEIFNCNINEKIIETYYENWIKGLPIVNRNYVNSVNKLSKTKFDNLLFAGDYSSLYPSMESAAKSGFETAKKYKSFT